MHQTPSSGDTPQNRLNELNDLREKLSRQRNLIPLCFALVVVFFFFGFCNFKCNGTKVASLKGINLVTGTHLKTSMDGAFNALDDFGGGHGKSKGEKMPPNLWAILAFGSAIAGFVIFYKRKQKETFWGAVLGGTGFISLFVLRLVIKGAVESQSGGMVAVDTTFLFGYWASVLAFITAGGISYLRVRAENHPPEPAEPSHTATQATPIHVRVVTQHDNDKQD